MNEDPGKVAQGKSEQESPSARPSTPVWRIQLFGGPILHSSTGIDITRFRSSKAAALLCYLALHHEKPCSREALMEALWPEDSDQSALPNRFRVTLASLRKQLEPPGFPFGSVLDNSVANCISLRKGATTCDVVEFESEYGLGNLARAAEIMQAPLLPAVYEDWAFEFQTRYALLEEELAPHRSTPGEAGGHAQNVGQIATQPQRFKTNLPSFLTEYVPNQTTLAQLSDLIQKHRLVTITGTAGIGKTRLSIETARASQLNAVFVPLAHCTADHEFFEAVIKALGVGTQNARSPEEQLLEALPAVDSSLIILDNIDHLIEPASNFLSLALSVNPQIRCLATSRQALEIPGETTFRLDTLPHPPTEKACLEDLYRYPATALFLKRVAQSRPDFRPQESQLPLIIEICARLEGLPLAVELAAAQISTLSIPEILNLLGQNLLELKSRQRTLSPKHRSLRAAIASSFEGLDEDILLFLGQLACFWGGFTREAAKIITGNPKSDEHIDELVQRSLINAQFEFHPTRFVFLEPVRQIAQEKLSDAQYQDSVQRHRRHFLELVARVDEEDLTTLEPLDQDGSNIEAAFVNPDPTDSLYWKACIGALTYSFLRGKYTAGMRRIRASRHHIDQIASPSVKRDWIVAALQILPEVELFDEALDFTNDLRSLAIQEGDPIAEFEYQIIFGLVLSRRNELNEGVECHRRALDLAQSLDSPKYIESALAHLSGSLHSYARLLPEDDPARTHALNQAKNYASQLSEIVSPKSRRHPLAYLLLAVAEFYSGDLTASKATFLRAQNSANTLQSQTIQLYCAFFLSEIAACEADASLAERYWQEFSQLQRQTGLVLNGTIWDRKSTG